MNRCKNCGAFEGGTTECLIVEATGPRFGKHVWQRLSEAGGAPGPEHWMNGGGAERPSRTPDSPGQRQLLDSHSDPRRQLLDSRRAPSAPLLTNQAALPQNPYLAGMVRQAIGERSNPYRSWHETILAECAPICRKIAATEPKRNPKLPADVRSRGPVV